MAETKDIRSDFAAIMDQDAWRVSRIHGSMFFLEIGEKQSASYRLRGEEREYTHGKWHFMFSMAQWRFENNGQIVIACEDEQLRIDEVFAELALGAVKKLILTGPGQDLAMDFASGVSLKTFSNSSVQDWDQWTLYCPDDRYWSATGSNRLVSGLASEPRPEGTT